MKTVACMAVHYGKEYIRWAIRGLAPVVDEIHIFYAPEPTFGFGTDLPCPDTLDELRAQVDQGITDAGTGFATWHEVRAVSEEVHRTFMLDCAGRREADVMVVADADEVWNPTALDQTVRSIYDARNGRRWLTRFANFWRSFDWMVDDQFRPVRFVNLRLPVTAPDSYLTEDAQPAPVYHFGYAQSAAMMRYKMSIHGHKAEFKPNWLDETFFGWKPGNTDTHPCVNGLWTPRPTDVRTRFVIDRLLHDHPYRGLAVIP